MTIEEQGIQTLLDLGLSTAQAKIWLTLNRLGDANITEVARNVKIDRAEVSNGDAKAPKPGVS